MLPDDALPTPAAPVAHRYLQQLVAVDNVLQDLVQRVADVQVAVGVRRAVVQREGGLHEGGRAT